MIVLNIMVEQIHAIFEPFETLKICLSSLFGRFECTLKMLSAIFKTSYSYQFPHAGELWQFNYSHKILNIIRHFDVLKKSVQKIKLLIHLMPVCAIHGQNWWISTKQALVDCIIYIICTIPAVIDEIYVYQVQVIT